MGIDFPIKNIFTIPQVFAGIDILIKNAHKIKQVFAGIDILIKYAHKIKPVFAGIDILIKKTLTKFRRCLWVLTSPLKTFSQFRRCLRVLTFDILIKTLTKFRRCLHGQWYRGQLVTAKYLRLERYSKIYLNSQIKLYSFL